MPAHLLSTNVLGTQVLLDSAREFKVGPALCKSPPTKFTGSLGRQVTSPNKAPTGARNSPYAASKAAADLLVLELRAYVRPAGSHHAPLQQLRSLSVSGKADPAFYHQPSAAISKYQSMVMA